jgi:hypothetical protein
MAVAARSDAAGNSDPPMRAALAARIAWVGPAVPRWLDSGKTAAGPFVLTSTNSGDPAAQVYIGLHSLLQRAWEDYQPQKAAIVGRHAAGAAAILDALLNDASLLAGLRKVASANARYRTGFFISPFAVAGCTWEAHFDRSGCLTMVHHSPGQAGHGPIVTIDGAADQKFVPLASRDQMVARYGEGEVARWEAAYLEGRRVDAFLAGPPAGPLQRPQAPFYSRDRWYLPVLQPGYDTRRDNLIVLDMTGERALPLMLDELSLLGSRAPRLVIITQAARIREMGEKTLFGFPVSDLLILPAAADRPVADLHLPLVLDAIGTALAGAWMEERAPETPGQSSIVIGH